VVRRRLSATCSRFGSPIAIARVPNRCLSNQPPLTFLIRACSIPSCHAISYVSQPDCSSFLKKKIIFFIFLIFVFFGFFDRMVVL
jgi:hypothetical protein